MDMFWFLNACINFTSHLSSVLTLPSNILTPKCARFLHPWSISYSVV